MGTSHKDWLQRITPAAGEEEWQHGALYRGVDEAVIRINGAHWYGMGALLHQQWPLEKLAFPLSRFVTSDNGATGLLGILEPLWVNSAGLGVMVRGDDVEVAFNAPLGHDDRWLRPDYKQLPNSFRPPLSSGLETDGLLTIKGRKFDLCFIEKPDVRAAVEAFWADLPPCPAPPRRVFERPMWTTWAQFKNDISQAQILQIAELAKTYGFSIGVFGIDAKWQREFGDTGFDAHKFPYPQELISALHRMNCEATLWVVPFIMPGSQNFREAVDHGFVFKNADGSPYLGRWWEGESVFLDFTNPAALRWFAGKLTALACEYGIDGFKFDAGEGQFYPVSGISSHRPFLPNQLAALYLGAMAQHFPWSDARAGWHCQGVPMLFRQWDKKTTWGFDNGLASCITQALTLNLLGYRFSFPDMIGGNEWAGDRGDIELIVRWAQAVAPMPVIQFSVSPWREGRQCAEICARYSALHSELAPLHERLAAEQAPMLRPVWWLAPGSEDALCCDDEYLVGDELLVAPVLQPHARRRDIYLPPGRWHDYWDAVRVFEGPGWLRDFAVELEMLPLFRRAG